MLIQTTMEILWLRCATWPNKTLFHERVRLQLVARPHTLAKCEPFQFLRQRDLARGGFSNRQKHENCEKKGFYVHFGSTNLPKAINAAAFQETINAFLAISSDHICVQLGAKCVAWNRFQWECRHQADCDTDIVANCLLLHMRTGKITFWTHSSISQHLEISDVGEVWIWKPHCSDSGRPCAAATATRYAKQDMQSKHTKRSKRHAKSV